MAQKTSAVKKKSYFSCSPIPYRWPLYIPPKNKKESAEAAVQKCPEKKVFWKYAANLQESTYAEV